MKTDKVDARILAQLLAADFLPPVWLPDDRTRALRRQVTRRAHLVRQRTRIKNQIHAILARNLAPTPPVSDLFGTAGRRWLSTQPLPADERSTVQALLRQLDFHGVELAVVDKELAIEALTDPMVARLMTIPGVDAIAAVSIVAAVGDFSRCRPGPARRLRRAEPEGPPVPQLRARARPDQQGRPSPDPGRAGGGRLVSEPGTRTIAGVLPEVRARRGFQTAVVATARKMTVLAWHLITKGPGLRVRPAQPGLPQTAQARTRRRGAVPAGQPRHPRCLLQQQAKTQRREGDLRTGRAVLPGLRRPPATPKADPDTHTGLTISSVELVHCLASVFQ